MIKEMIIIKNLVKQNAKGYITEIEVIIGVSNALPMVTDLQEMSKIVACAKQLVDAERDALETMQEVIDGCIQ